MEVARLNLNKIVYIIDSNFEKKLISKAEENIAYDQIELNKFIIKKDAYYEVIDNTKGKCNLAMFQSLTEALVYYTNLEIEALKLEEKYETNNEL